MSNPTFSPQNLANAERGASVIAGSLLLYNGLRKRSWTGMGMALTGAALVGHGVTGARRLSGQSAVVPYRQGIRIDKTVTVNKPRYEVYSYWRNLENLPVFMRHLERVRPVSDTVSHWVAQGALGRLVEWDAEIITDSEGEMLSWRSLPGAGVRNAGSIQFRDAAGNRGTVVKVALQYLPPAGALGTLAVKLFGDDPDQQVEEDLRRFKTMLETGEVPANLHAYNRASEKKIELANKDANVHQNSEESFPASDAPAWT